MSNSYIRKSFHIEDTSIDEVSEMKERKRIEARIADMVRERLSIVCRDGSCSVNDSRDKTYSRPGKSEVTSDSDTSESEVTRSKSKTLGSKKKSKRRTSSGPPD